MVTRNRQREHENENERLHDQAIRQHRLADLASWQDKVFFNVTIPVLVPVSEPPAPKRIEKTITDPSHKLTREQKDTKQGTMKPKTGQHWEDLLPNPDERRTLKREFEFFNQHLNYHWGNLWGIRHCEIEYEGESDPL